MSNRQQDPAVDFMIALCAIVLTLLLFGMAGEADIEEQERQQREYCWMILNNKWPAYRGVELCEKHNEEKGDGSTAR